MESGAKASFCQQQRYVFNGQIPLYNTTIGVPAKFNENFSATYRERLATEWSPVKTCTEPPLLMQGSEMHHKYVGHIPNYTGYIPGAKFRDGKTFGKDSKDARRWLRGEFDF